MSDSTLRLWAGCSGGKKEKGEGAGLFGKCQTNNILPETGKTKMEAASGVIGRPLHLARQVAASGPDAPKR